MYKEEREEPELQSNLPQLLSIVGQFNCLKHIIFYMPIIFLLCQILIFKVKCGWIKKHNAHP